MPFFPSLPAAAGVPNIYKSRSKTYLHWIRMGDEVMSAEAPLSRGVRELLATFVSSLNHCRYCRAAHLPAMKLHDLDPFVVDALVVDVDRAPIDAALKPIFRFAKKLTLAPHCLSQHDADEVFVAGWSEEALHWVIGVTCRFNFMNRLVMGFGLEPPSSDAARHAAARREEDGYAGNAGELSNE